MPASHVRRWLVVALVAFAPQSAQAQTPELPPGRTGARSVAVGGDVAAMLAPPEDHSYFNYTDYDLDALRVLRIRLFGEWHLASQLSILGELRTENTSRLSASALYVRWQPARERGLYIQAGRIPPSFGAFGRRAYGRDNAVLGLPLAYQYLTSLRSDSLPATADDLLRMRGRGWQPSYPVGTYSERAGLALISGARWDTGIQALWEGSIVSASGAVTRGSPAEPVVRDINDGLMWSGRAAARLPGALVVGIWAARGQWLSDAVLSDVTSETRIRSQQSVAGVDVELGSGPWLIRAEALRSTFDVPFAAAAGQHRRLDATSGYVEARFRFHPRFQIGTRVDRLDFGGLENASTGLVVPWDYPVSRVEAVLGVRLTRQVELRGGWQYNRRARAPAETRHLPIAGLLYWF